MICAYRLNHAFPLTIALFSLALCAVPARAGDVTPGAPPEQSAADRQAKADKDASDNDFFSWIKKMAEPAAGDQKKPRVRPHEGGDRRGGNDHGGGGGHK
ncbi:MAG TPA: hypothetical protein VGQ35_12680 [Dongiaceae bacterium]|jgi:hypothetical protein|nr:hypothetical protein [Dongiaceae bacterium]